jgi:phosphoribosyl-ATP pyrophosphohydrolase/phosphoribosyl-AMP cyclohydrolase
MKITNKKQFKELAWKKSDNLLPAIVQDAYDGRVLMQAFMSRKALDFTLTSGRVTFWSRSRKKLWTKGETSGNYLLLEAIHSDCDRDSLLVLARPHGPTCHLGTASCFDDEEEGPTTPSLAFLGGLDRLLKMRHYDLPQGSYSTELFEAGIRRIAQKVGEEGVETALAAVGGDDKEVCDESADLIYHLFVLLRSRGMSFERVIETLKGRHG